MSACKKKLALLWFVGSALLLFVTLGKWLGNAFPPGTIKASWEWVLQMFMPTLSLMVAVYVMDAQKQGMEKQAVNSFVYRMAYGFSALYLGLVFVVILAQPFTPLSFLELSSQANLFLIPLQGLVTASVGVFFFKKDEAAVQ